MSASRESQKPLHDRFARVVQDFFELWADSIKQRNLTFVNWAPRSVGAELAPPTIQYSYKGEAGDTKTGYAEIKDMLRDIELAIANENGAAGGSVSYKL